MILRSRSQLALFTAIIIAAPLTVAVAANVTIYPAPSGETLSSLYAVRIENRPVPVYTVRVAPGDGARRMDAMDYDKNSGGEIFDEGAFTYFDMQGPVDITVSYKNPISTARLLPAIPGTRLTTDGKTVHFALSAPRNFVLEVNHEIATALQIFANPVESDVPSPSDPNVVYFGPGIHEVGTLTVGNGKTLYIAGGAIIRTKIDPNEPSKPTSRANVVSYEPAIKLVGSGIKVRGRGIVDGSLVSQEKGLFQITGQSISLDGIILRNSTLWNMPIRNSQDVTVTNVKLISYRLNSDGIDIVSSRNVKVAGCYIRTFDDLIVVKSLAAGGPASDILARNNVLWNEKGHAMSVGAEVQADISKVTFLDNDVINDVGHDWTMRVYLSDTGNVSDIRFENIRVNQTCLPGVPQNQCPALIALTIQKSSWGRGGQLGNIRNISFRNIQDTSTSPRDPILLAGVGPGSDIEGVELNNITINGRAISKGNVKQNSFVRDVSVR
jgi:hypothetical protein